MPLEIPADLPRPLAPLAWLVGTWAGVGVVGYPTTPESRFGQEVVVTHGTAHDGAPFLAWSSRAWLLDDAGERVAPLATETGYWRVATPSAPDATGPAPADVELVLAHPTGVVEVFVGRVDGPRIELQTDAVVRTGTAHEYTAATRMYGLVEGDLLWVLDMAAHGHPLQSHMSARLRRS